MTQPVLWPKPAWSLYHDPVYDESVPIEEHLMRAATQRLITRHEPIEVAWVDPEQFFWFVRRTLAKVEMDEHGSAFVKLYTPAGFMLVKA